MLTATGVSIYRFNAGRSCDVYNARACHFAPPPPNQKKRKKKKRRKTEKKKAHKSVYTDFPL